MFFRFFCCTFGNQQQQQQKDFEMYVQPTMQQIHRIQMAPIGSRGRPKYHIAIKEINGLNLPDATKSELIQLVKIGALQSDSGLIAMQKAILILYQNKSSRQILVLQWLLSSLEP